MHFTGVHTNLTSIVICYSLLYCKVYQCQSIIADPEQAGFVKTINLRLTRHIMKNGMVIRMNKVRRYNHWATAKKRYLLMIFVCPKKIHCWSFLWRWRRWDGGENICLSWMQGKFRLSSKKTSHHLSGENSEEKHDFWKNSSTKSNIISFKIWWQYRSVILDYHSKSPWSRRIFVKHLSQ